MCDEVLLALDLAPPLHLTQGADSKFQLLDPASGVVLSKGALVEGAVAQIRFRAPAGAASLELESRAYYCDPAGACRADNALFVLPIAEVDRSSNSPLGEAPRLVQRIVAPPPAGQ